MNFNVTPISLPTAYRRSVQIGGHFFPPDAGSVEERLRAVEESMASIDNAITTLARELENISRALSRARNEGRI
jgi:hypothetical protein